MLSISRRPDLPILYTTGSFYEVGFDVGRTFADRINRYWRASDQIQSILIPFMDTAKGKEYFKSTLEVCKSAYPQYIREIEGMAEGSGIPFKNLFMLNLKKEICSVLAPSLKETSNGCSDILVNRPGCKVIGHNEDTFHALDSFIYLVSARIVENEEEVESFTAFCYPGVMPGCALNFNRHGMVFTCDGLYPKYVVERAPPREFLNRAVIKAKNITEAIDILKCEGYGAAYGFTCNIADVKDPSSMWSVEIGPQERESKMHVYTLREETDPSKPCHYIHINSIEHLQDVAEIENLQSSVKRRERANQMDAPRTKEGVLTILGDSTDPEYPIFRTARPTDMSATIFTAVVDILENRIDIYRENPAKPGQIPLFHLPIKDGSN